MDIGASGIVVPTTEVTQTVSKTAQDAASPFDSRTADVILRSADNVDFRVHRAILMIASEVFEDLFSLPESSADDNRNLEIVGKIDERKEGLPVVSMAEDARGLDMLLRFCYPITPPECEKVPDIVLALRLVRKFQLAHVSKPQEQLMLVAQREPERAYAIGCTFQLPKIALAAARYALTTRDQDLALHAELGAISSFDLIRLRKYHVATLSAMSNVFADLKWLSWSSTSPDMTLFDLTRCSMPNPYTYRHICADTSCPPVNDDQPGHWRVCGEDMHVMFKPWVARFLEDAARAIMKRPDPRVIYDINTVLEAYGGAAGCLACKTQARYALPKFAGLIAAQLEAAVSQVRLELPF